MESFRSPFRLCGYTKNSRKEDMDRSNNSSTPNSSSRRKPLQELNVQKINSPSVSSPSLYKYHGCQVIPEETEDQENICPLGKHQQKQPAFLSPDQSDKEKSSSTGKSSKSDTSPFAYPLIWESTGSGVQSGESRDSPRSTLTSHFSGGLPSAHHSTHCTSTPSKSHHVTPPAVFRTPSEHFSRSSERLRSTRTPKNYVRNPFDTNVDNLCCMTVSPSLFQKVTSPSQTEDTNFRWSVDQLAALHPVLFETSPSTIYEFPVDPEMEQKAQEAIDLFFSQSKVVPSPWSGSVKKINLLKLAEGVTPKTSSKTSSGGDSVITKEGWTQTELTLPPELPPEVEAVLANYYTFTQDQNHQNSAEAEDIANLSNSTLRRKLLFSYDSSPDGSLKDRSPSMNQKSQESPPFVISDELLAEDAVFCSGSMIRRDSGLSGTRSSQLSSPDVSPINLGNEHLKPSVVTRSFNMRDSICDSVVKSKSQRSFNQAMSPALSPISSLGFKSQHSPHRDSGIVQRLSPVTSSSSVKSGLTAHKRHSKLSGVTISPDSPQASSSRQGSWMELVYEGKDRTNTPQNGCSPVVLRLSNEGCKPFGENELRQVRSCPPCPESESSHGMASLPLSKHLSHSVTDVVMTCEEQAHDEEPYIKVKEIGDVAEAGMQLSGSSGQEATPKVCHQNFCVQTQFSSSPIQARGQSMMPSTGDKLLASPPVSPILGRYTLAAKSYRCQSQPISQNYMTSQSPHMSIDVDEDGTVGIEKCDIWISREKDRPGMEERQKEIIPHQLPFVETTNLTSMVDMDTEGQPFFEPISAVGESSTIDMVSQDTGYQTGSFQITSNLMAISNFASESLQVSKYETGGQMTSHEVDPVQCQRIEAKLCHKGRNEELGCSSLKTKILSKPVSHFGSKCLSDLSEGSQIKSSNLLSRQSSGNSEDSNLTAPVPIGSSTPTKYM